MGTLTQMLCNLSSISYTDRDLVIGTTTFYHCVLVTYWPLFQKYNEKKETKFNLISPFYPVILTAISTDNKPGSVPIRSSSHVRCTLQLL